MTIDDIISQFQKVNNNSEYVRISAEHPLELYVGLNENGLKTLRYNGKFTPIKVYSTKNLDVKQYKNNNISSILFTYISPINDSLFFKFCEDIINSTIDCEQENGYKFILNRYTQWKKFFSTKATILTEPEIMGLIGELLFLKDYSFKIYGISKGISGWSGPDPTHKDFSYNSDWYEIKTIGTSSKSVKISSLEQLDSSDDGYLVINRLEKMSEKFSGITLNKLVEIIRNTIEFDEDKELFENKLLQVGYTYNELYDTFVYNYVDTRKYLVNDIFPRIKSESLPKGIINLTYEIELSSIHKLEVK